MPKHDGYDHIPGGLCCYTAFRQSAEDFLKHEDNNDLVFNFESNRAELRAQAEQLGVDIDTELFKRTWYLCWYGLNRCLANINDNAETAEEAWGRVRASLTGQLVMSIWDDLFPEFKPFEPSPLP